MSAVSRTGRGMDSEAVLNGALALFRGVLINADILKPVYARNTQGA